MTGKEIKMGFQKKTNKQTCNSVVSMTMLDFRRENSSVSNMNDQGKFKENLVLAQKSKISSMNNHKKNNIIIPAKKIL